MVERVIPGLTSDRLLEAQRLLHEAALRVSEGAAKVHYLRCTFVAEEQWCICLFEASDVDVVRRVNDIAQVPFRRIQPASEFSAPGIDGALKPGRPVAAVTRERSQSNES